MYLVPTFMIDPRLTRLHMELDFGGNKWFTVDSISTFMLVKKLINSYKRVLVANGALNALETLREFEGFFDLVITELHLSRMNGFEFQKRVENEFQIPIIMMSADRRKSVMSKSLANGAVHYILKPVCADDFKDIWQYAMAARKRKLTTENIERESLAGDNVFIQDVNSATSSSENMRKRKCGQRKSTRMNKEGLTEERTCRLVKKPKIVWTTYLHNLFLLAIKQIGLEKAVPKTILEVMNVPNLKRENVASHLQKYRIFLRKVAEKGLLEGLSNRDLKSRFASGLSASVIKEFQARTAKSRDPVQQYMKRLTHQRGFGGNANAVKPYNHVSRSTNYVSTPLGRRQQFPHPCHQGLNTMLHNKHAYGDSLNQARFGVQSSFGTNARANNIQKKMLGSYANPPYCAKSSYNNAGAVFPSDGIMGHGLMTSANGLIKGGLKYGDHQLMYPNYGSLGNHHKFSYGQGNWKMGSLNNSHKRPWTTITYNPSSDIQLNGGSQMVGNGTKGGFNSTVGTVDSIANNNSFGLINGTTQNANKNVAPLGQGNFGLAQGGLAVASASASSAGDGWSNELPALLTNNGTRAENISGNPQLPQQLDGNVAENDNASSIGEDKVSHLEDHDLSDLFIMLDEMDLLIETEENPNASEYLKSNLSSSSHTVQSLEQSNSASDVIVNPIESTLNLPNESPTSSDKNSNQEVKKAWGSSGAQFCLVKEDLT
ncbi:Two-component response regulator ARR2 [Spatholobus suberectus]|nr:Two-component response regulator ARR2 [Spatholobus suberectus]